MARYLRQNTARTITVGPFFDVTDGITPELSLTVTNCHLTLVVDNEGTPTLALDANATASGGSNDMAHISANDDAGYYTLELTAANTNYVGGALLTITDTNVHLPVFHEFTILPASVYDSMIAGSALFDVNTSTISATAVDSILDEAVEGSYTLRQLVRAIAAVSCSKLSGAATTTVAIRDLADSKNRIVMTVDADGNRTDRTTFDVT